MFINLLVRIIKWNTNFLIRMNILHITNSYGGTEVYTNLYKSIDDKDLVQTIFVPLNANNHDRIGNKPINFKNKESRILYSTKLKKYHKYLYRLKINAIVSEIKEIIDLSKIDLIHASTLCLDGAVAYELNKEYGIPYIVAVRNTDVSVYYKKLIWRHDFFTRIIENAKRIIFISPKYRENFIRSHVPAILLNEIENKTLVLPNGVSQIFLDNTKYSAHSLGSIIKIIFVAAFNKGKGLIEAIKAIDNLRQKGYCVELNAIGKGLPNRPCDEEYVKEVEKLSEGKEWVKLQPFMKPEDIINEMRKSDIFVMVSSPETFGLVYVEALTQKLPIIYAKDQGFDGFYSEGFVGYHAQAGNVIDIQESIEKVINNYNRICDNLLTIDLQATFDWKYIGLKYIKIYNELI